MTVGAVSTEELRELYRELILDHARSPRHFGKLDQTTHTAEGINPLCGDKLKLYFRIGDDDRIEEAAFEGSGCAISVASASLLTEAVIGLETGDALGYFEKVVGRLTGEQQSANADDLGKLAALEGVREFPSRVKCATLAWHAMNSAIKKHDAAVTTE